MMFVGKGQANGSCSLSHLFIIRIHVPMQRSAKRSPLFLHLVSKVTRENTASKRDLSAAGCGRGGRVA